jgi:phage terminase large subunit
MTAATATRPRQLVVELYPQQDDFVHDAHRYVGFLGGRNSGKTYAGSWKAVTKIMAGGLGFIGAPSFPMLENGAKRQFLARLEDASIAHVVTRSGVVVPSSGGEVIFVTLENEGRIRGPNFDWGWVDEVEYLSDPLVWKAAKGAVREGPAPQLFVTSTPKGRRLVYAEWVLNGTEHHALYRATTFDNPFIDADDYVAGLGYTDAFYQQEIDAEFVSFEGLVYPRFDRGTHVRSLETDNWSTVLGLDVGTRNPTALLTVRHAGDRLHVERELYRRGMSSDDIVDETVVAYNNTKATHVVVDPSAAALIASLQRRGVKCRKADNDILIGISRVTSALESLTVDPSCVNTIDEFESYRYPDGGRSGERDVPVKANDHAMDVIRYLCMDLFGRPQAKGWLI